MTPVAQQTCWFQCIFALANLLARLARLAQLVRLAQPVILVQLVQLARLAHDQLDSGSLKSLSA